MARPLRNSAPQGAQPRPTKPSNKLSRRKKKPWPYRSLVLRASAVFLLLVIVDLWSVRHIGIGPTSPGRLAPLIAAIGAAAALVLRFLPERLRNAAWAHVVDAGRRLRPRWIVLAYGMFFVITAFFSSLEVVGVRKGDLVKLSATGFLSTSREATSADGENLRFTGLLINPFGRRYLVKVKGYAPVTKMVLPFFGGSVILGSEVPLASSLLVRPSPALLASLDNGGKLIVVHGADTLGPGKGKRSFIIGEDRPVSQSLQSQWQPHLQAFPAEVQSRTLHSWQNPGILRSRTPITTGDTLIIALYTRIGVLKAADTVVVGSSVISDLYLDEQPAPDEGQSL